MATKKRFPSEEQERFIVRLPDGMRARIAEAAKANGRSMNSEIIARLEESFRANSALPLVDAAARAYVAVEIEAAALPDDAELRETLARLRENITEALLTVARHRRDGHV